LAPAGDEKQERKVLKAMTIKPTVNWFREKPNSLEPTLEVTVP
jgi:hypothetical protein